MSAALAGLMALVAGTLVAGPLCRGGGSVRVALMLGYGAWIGCALLATCVLVASWMGLGTSLLAVTSLVLVATLLANLFVRTLPVVSGPGAYRVSAGGQVLVVLFGALILLHVVGWFIEVWMNPLLAQPVLEGAGLEARRFWLAPTAVEVPSMTGRLLIWPALIADAWIEPGMGALWTLAGLALLLGGYAQLRIAGLPPLGALVAVYMLVTLPAFGARIMLPGSSGIWIAAGLGLAWAAALNALRGGNRGQWALAAASALPLIGLSPGACVWLAAAAIALVLARWPARWTLPALALIAACVVAALAYEVHVDLGPLGAWGRSGSRLSLGALGQVPFNDDLALTLTAREFVVFDAWHLIWLPLLAAPLLALPSSGGQLWWRAAMVFTVLAVVRMVIVMTTTDELALAGEFNRVLLGATPALWVGAVLMLVDWLRAGRVPLHYQPLPAPLPVDDRWRAVDASA